MLHEQSVLAVIKVKMLRFCLPLLIAHVSGFKFVNVGPGCGVSNPFINIWTQASLQKKWYKRCLMLHKDFEYQGVKLLGKGTFPKHPNYIKKLIHMVKTVHNRSANREREIEQRTVEHCHSLWRALFTVV